MNLEIGERERAAVRRHGQDAYPSECCGFLLGTVAEKTRSVVRVRRAENTRTDQPRTRYMISPEAYLAAERAAEQEGLEVVGFYHSHPEGEARPSEFDRAHALPGCSYLLVSVMGGRAGDLRAWGLAGDRSRFDPEPLDVPATDRRNLNATMAGSPAPAADRRM